MKARSNEDFFSNSILEEDEVIDSYESLSEEDVKEYKKENPSASASGLIMFLPENTGDLFDKLKLIKQQK